MVCMRNESSGAVRIELLVASTGKSRYSILFWSMAHYQTSLKIFSPEFMLSS